MDEADSGIGPSLNCPIDSTPLDDHRVRGLPACRCGRCSGLWLPRGTVDECLKIDLWQLAGISGKDYVLGCPGEEGVKLMRFRHNGAHIDFCGSCGGLWLDRGELEAIRRCNESKGATGSAVSEVATEVAFSGGLELVGAVFGAIVEGLFDI